MYPRGMKTCLPKGWHTNVYSSIIYISSKVETIQTSISWWMDNPMWDSQTTDHSPIKKEQLLIHAQPDNSQKHYVKWKKPDSKDYKLYGSTYVNYSRKVNKRRRKADQWRLRVEAEMNSKWHEEALLWCWRCSNTGLWWWLYNFKFTKYHWIVHL